MKKEMMLTTTDNPYDPFTQFDDWYAFDVSKGYNTCAYLARIAVLSDEMSDKERDSEIDVAIDEIVQYNLLAVPGVSYKKVYSNA